MNKNIKILLGALGLLIIGIAVYFAIQGGAKSIVSFGNKTTQKVTGAPAQNNKESIPGSVSGITPPPPNDPRVMICKDNKTVTLSYATSGLFVTLTDSTGKRDFAMSRSTTKPKKYPTFQDTDGKVFLIMKGYTSEVEEKGKVTFAECGVAMVSQPK